MSTVNELVAKLGLDTVAFDNGAARAERSATSLTKRLEQQAATFGMPAREAKITGLALKGASAETIAAATANAKHIASLERQAEEQKQAARVIESVRTPLENYNRELAQLDRMLVRGQIDQQTYNRAVDMARNKFGALDPAIARAGRSAGIFHGIMRAGRGVLSGVGDVAGRLTRVLFSVQGALLGAAGAGGMALLIKNSLGTIDQTAKVADRLNITTEELVGFRHAAELAGASSETFDKGLTLLTRSIGEVATGIGTEAKVALDRLGLSAEELAAKSPADAFRDVAEAMSNVENAAERTAIAQKLFGRGGVELVNTLMLGKDGLAAMQAEAERLGMTFSRMDASKVEAANDAMTRMKAVATGTFQSLAIELAPFIEAMANGFIRMATAGEGVGGKVVGAFEYVIKAIATGADYLSLFKSGFHALQGVVLGVVSFTVETWDKMISVIIDGLNMIPGVDIPRPKFLDNLGDELRLEAGKALKEAGEEFDSFMDGDASRRATEAFTKIRADAAAAAEAATAARPDAGVDEEAFAAAAKQAEQIQSVIDKLKEQQATLGMTSEQQELYKLKQMGATDATIAQAEAIQQQIKEMQNAADATKIIDDLKTKLDGLGQTDIEKTVAQLKALGATSEQIKDAQLYLAKIREVEEAQKERQELEQFAKGVIDSQITPLQKQLEVEAQLKAALEAKLITQEQYNQALADANKQQGGKGKEVSRFDFMPRMDAATMLAERNGANVKPAGGLGDKPVEVEGQDKVIGTLVGIRGDLQSTLNRFDIA